MRNLRKVFVVGALVTAVPVAGASIAYACTALATLSFTSASAAPGATVSGTGRGFNGGGHGTEAGTTPVVLRWQTRNGPILTSTAPTDAAGNISYSFTVPANATAGQYVVIGIQTNPANGNPFYGTPARQALQVTVAGSRTSERVESAPAPVAANAAPAQGSESLAPIGGAQPALNGAVTPALATAPTKDQTGRAAAPVAVTPASSRDAAPTVAADLTSAPASAAPVTPAAAIGSAAAPAAAVVATAPAAETFTPGLVLASPEDGRSVTPALLVLVMGMLLSLVAIGRWLSSRLPNLRSTAPA